MAGEVDNDSLIGLINQLVEPAEPPRIPMVPQTWGWVVLAGLVLAGLAYALWRWQRHRRANAYRREALQMLAASGDDPARIAEILRRAALAAYPREMVAGLAGQDWLHFLDSRIGGSRFAEGEGRVLASAPYRPTAPDPGLTSLARVWVLQHRGAAT